MFSFENCDVIVNGSGIMAESATLSTQAAMTPIQSLGFLHPYGYTQSGPFQNILQISYYIESRNEPIYNHIMTLKGFLTGASNDLSMIAAVGGITGTYYVDSYSIQSNDHSPIKASVSLISFSPLSGALQPGTGNTAYNTASSTGLAHSYSSFISFRRINTVSPFEIFNQKLQLKNIRSFSYNLKSNWNPIFGLGSTFPATVRFNSAEETVQVIHEDFNLMGPTGIAPWTGLSLFDFSTQYPPTISPSLAIVLAPYSKIPIISREIDWPFISVSDGIVKSSQIVHAASNVARVNTTITRTY